MKSYTRAGFLYYQITQINKFPGIIICSDKETVSHSFANEDIRDNYIQDLTQDLSNVGVTLYQIPYTATWVNPAVVLSVRALQSNLIVIEFPWNYELQFKYSSLEQRNTVYNDILSNLKSSPSGDFLTKAEADATYLSINKAEDTYATQQDVTNDLNKKANKNEVVNLVDNQTIAGDKSFTGELSINGNLKDTNFGKVISTNMDTLSIGDENKNIVLKAKDNAIIQKGTDNYVILDSENYGEYIEGAGIATTQKVGLVKPDGTTITIKADGTITSVGGGSVSGEKYGIRGDYSTRYGIIECPNGLISYTGKNLTFAQGIRVELAGGGKALIGGALHTVESTTDFDLFYVSGGFDIGGETKNFLECSDVFYQEAEPEDGQVNCAAWWNPAKQKWSFKSNAAGNVWAEAVACRIAHIHVNEENITNISYAGNRILDDEIFIEKTLTDDGYLSLPKTQVSESLILQNGNTNLSFDFSNGTPQIGVVGKDVLDFITPIEFAVKNPTINSDLTYAQLSNASVLTKAQVIEAIKMYSPTVHNSVVLTTSVKDDADVNYPYLNTFNIEGAKPTYIPTAILSSDQVISGNYSSVTESIEGAITIRTKVELEAGTIIPQVILQPTF